MSDLTLYGLPMSTYTRAARLVCEEKGVSYSLEPRTFGSKELLEVHPFGKLPAARHGDFVLFETSAICRYIDDAFEGPKLTPADTERQALMEQWMSAVNAYFDPILVRQIVRQRLLVPMRGGTPDETVVADALEKGQSHFAVLERTLGDADFLTGNTISIADLMLAPAMASALKTDEGKRLLAEHPAVSKWFERVSSRQSFAATEASKPAGNR